MSNPTPTTLGVLFTMDCLPPGASCDCVRCPEDRVEAEHAVAAFSEALAQEQLSATLFVAPQALPFLDETTRRCRDAGAELGLLCHPQLAGYQTWLGSYSFERQREILRTMRAAWQKQIGTAPEALRPGFYSANDHTFHAACMERFRHGSCSLPGRVDNEQHSVWQHAPQDPHHTDPLDRSSAGSMEFFEFPVAADTDSAASLEAGTYTPRHLRIEAPDLNAWAEPFIASHVDGMISRGVPVPTVTFVTSNLAPWGCDVDPHVERLQNLCALLRRIAEERDMTLAGPGMGALHDLWHQQSAAPSAASESA
jgi:hypothetical protein